MDKEAIVRIIAPKHYEMYEWAQANSETPFDISDLFAKADAIIALQSSGREGVFHRALMRAQDISRGHVGDDQYVCFQRLNDTHRFITGVLEHLAPAEPSPMQRNAIIEECAVAAEALARGEREWVRDSLWATIKADTAAAIRALKVSE